MTAVSAPSTVSAIAPPGKAQAAPGNNALSNGEGQPADFASMLKTLQKLAGQPTSGEAGVAVVASAAGEPAASDTRFTAVLKELGPAREDKPLSEEGETGLDIAAMLGQINGQLNAPTAAPTIPALTPAATRHPDLFEPPSEEDTERGTPKGLDIAALATQKKPADEAPGLLKKEPVEGLAEFTLPESASNTAPAHGLSQHKPHGPHTETTKLDIATPVHSPNWSAEVGQRVVWMAKNDVQEAQLSVNPPHLGPIEITLSLKDDNATAHFSSPHAEVRAALEEALPRLREMLAGAGVQLGQSDVGAQSQQAFQQFSGKHNRSAADDQAHFGEEHPSLQPNAAVNPSVSVRTLKGNGLVDTFV